MSFCDANCFVLNDKINFNLKKGSFLFSVGDVLENIYFVEQGLVKITSITSDGNERILDLKQDGDYIGLVNILKNQQLYNVNAEALTDCVISKVNVHIARQELYGGNQCLMNKCLDSAANRIQINDILNLETDSDVRIINTLNYLYKKFGKIENGKKVVNLRISKADIASMIGMARETLSRKLSSMAQKGLIKIEKSKIIFLK